MRTDQTGVMASCSYSAKRRSACPAEALAKADNRNRNKMMGYSVEL